MRFFRSGFRDKKWRIGGLFGRRWEYLLRWGSRLGIGVVGGVVKFIFIGEDWSEFWGKFI